MGCGCGSSSCGGNPCTTAPRSTVFTVQTPESYGCSLARELIGTADLLRDLFTVVGMRPYLVRLVRTQWSTGVRGRGDQSVIYESEPILPTPLVMDLSGLAVIVTAIGADEQHGLLVTEISGCYTEEQIRGLDDSDGAPIPADQSFYWEIEFLRADGVKGERRRFNVSAAPTYVADEFQWKVTLERARPDRTRNGMPR